MPLQQRFELLITPNQLADARKTARDRGFNSCAAYLRALLDQDQRRNPPGQPDREAIVAASIERLARELRAIHTANQALFALTDSLARLFLTCIQEPPAEHLDSARRRAKQRYDRFLLSVAQNMAGNSRRALAELMEKIDAF